MSSSENLCLAKKPRTEAAEWCFTSTKDTELSFAWTIDNFSRKMESYKPGKRIDSHTFKVSVEGLETSWRLCCYPNGLKEESSGNVGMFLNCNDATPLKALKRQLICSIELVNGNGSKINKKSFEKCCTDGCWGKEAWGFAKFVSHEKLRSDNNKCLPGDCFEVFCQMKIDGQEVTTGGPSLEKDLSRALEHDKEENMSDSGLENLLKTGVLADVELVCEGRTFSCHKAILASKSPVFMAIFCNNMTEKAMGKINIKGIEPDTMKDILTHVYGGKIEELEDKAEELLAAADRYDLKQLKQSCEKMLAIRLDIDNCLDCLILADRHSSSSLKPVVIKFIVSNFLEVVALDNWMEMLNTFSEVFQEVFDELASLRSTKDKKQSNNDEDK